jgi:hypothetical protein
MKIDADVQKNFCNFVQNIKKIKKIKKNVKKACEIVESMLQ